MVVVVVPVGEVEAGDLPVLCKRKDIRILIFPFLCTNFVSYTSSFDGEYGWIEDGFFIPKFSTYGVKWYSSIRLISGCLGLCI